MFRLKPGWRKVVSQNETPSTVGGRPDKGDYLPFRFLLAVLFITSS